MINKTDDTLNISVNYISTRQLAKHWNLSKSTLGRWRIIGIGPVFLKLGNRIRYRLEDVKAYEKNILRKSTSERVSESGDNQWT